ncbi:hypothetical protein GN958_ATG05133 [Phytophthora infestans]|uniref:Uncharacterized protein n=1 Tax=Phytophthora infestans TaxID=4787 RepID=A0A8S9UYF9_PHYIN|nr:hypothetical protein GN958_ATG05133 [Phytophthora infestans]
MAFRTRWAELKKVGWMSKRPSRLSNLHTYIQPDKTRNGERGEDYFVGEEELMKYLNRQDLGRLRCATCYCSLLILFLSYRSYVANKRSARTDWWREYHVLRARQMKTVDGPTSASPMPVSATEIVSGSVVASFESLGTAPTPVKSAQDAAEDTGVKTKAQ